MTELPLRSVREVTVETLRGTVREPRKDTLAVEEPLEIRLRHGPLGARVEATLGLTMRTPGHDEELAAGLLLSEGVFTQRAALSRFDHGRDRDGHPDPNVIIVELAPGVHYDPHANERALLRSSACGVCGRASLDALRAKDPPRFDPEVPYLSGALLRSLPARLRTAQRVFATTGGLHAAALFGPDGSIRSLREDVGRHNAVDKLVGAEFLASRTPLSNLGLLVSGRASFEILQKALRAGIPVVAALGAPSSLAVDLAHEFGQTLVGFLKSDSFNVYTGPSRIDAGAT